MIRLQFPILTRGARTSLTAKTFFHRPAQLARYERLRMARTGPQTRQPTTGFGPCSFLFSDGPAIFFEIVDEGMQSSTGIM
ncbi:MAG: hypothetical protein DMG18_14130 [Acidobacteria bacterium]|nr:MAG: hypothetical protein DMG18_14130 [Acidobacteriota bacterium]